MGCLRDKRDKFFHELFGSWGYNFGIVLLLLLRKISFVIKRVLGCSMKEETKRKLLVQGRPCGSMPPKII
jgi:hypothetical protein